MAYEVESVRRFAGLRLRRCPASPLGAVCPPGGRRGRYDLTVTVDGLLLEGRAIAGVGIHKGEVDWVNLSIGDADTGIRYTTGKIPFTTIGSLQDDGSAPDGFIISGPENNNIVDVFPLTARGNKTGPTIGTICFGDLVYTRTD